MNRRKVLFASGVTLSSALAGCSDDELDAENGDGGNGGDDPNGTGDENGEEETENEGAAGQDDEAATSSISITDVTLRPDHAEPGERVEVSIEVENSGDADGELDYEVTADSTPIAEATVVVRAGRSAIGTRAIRIEDEGRYDIAVNGIHAGTLTIEAPDPQDYTFEGTGSVTHSSVDLTRGLTVVEGSHDGDSNFQVRFLNEEANRYERFFDEPGEYDGTNAALLDLGTYLIDVVADGNWTLEVRQPRATEAEAASLPRSLEGHVPDVIGPIAFDGRHTAYGEHDGDSKFQVQIFPADGASSEVVIDESGDYEGESTFSHDGVGWIDVEADGPWSIEIE